MPDRRFEIEAAKYMSGDKFGLAVTVRDEVSGVVLAMFDLTPDEVFRVFTGHGTVKVDGRQGKDLSRIGKRMEVKVAQPEPDVWRDVGATQEQQVANAVFWAEQVHPGWDEYHGRATNSGPTVVMRRWVEEGEEASPAREE